MSKVTVQYRYLKEEGLSKDFNLKDSIIKYLKSKDGIITRGLNAKTRVVDVDYDGSVYILNKISEEKTWNSKIFRGQLLHLENGAHLPALIQSLDDDTSEFELGNILLDETKKVLRGALYFCITGNHVGLIEDNNLRSRSLEKFLSKILQDVDILTEGQPIILKAEFYLSNGKHVDKVKEISVSTPPFLEKERRKKIQIQEKDIATIRKFDTTVFDILEVLGWEDKAIESLKSDIPADGWIEGLFSFVIKQKRKKCIIPRTTIDEALRNIDPSDITIRGEGIENGGLMKLTTSTSVGMVGALKDPKEAFEKIETALKDWALSGKINCQFE